MSDADETVKKKKKDLINGLNNHSYVKGGI